MSFYKRYELARLIQEDDAKTFSAVQIATGRPVVLHLLAPSASLTAEFLRDIVARAEQHPAVLEVGEFAGSYYIATEPPQSPQSFRQWVETLPPAQPAKAVQPAPPPLSKPKPVVRPTEPSRKLPEVRKLNIPPSPPIPPTSGEFTELFGVPKAKISGKNEPGEFTKMFYGGAPGKPAKVAPPSPTDLNDTGGEFTKLFSGHSAQPDRPSDEFKAVFDAPLSEPEDAAPVPAVLSAPAWPVAAPEEDETSEYTKFFGDSLPSEPVDIPAEQAKQAGVVEAKEKPFRQASDFTRMFGPGGAPGRTPPPQAPTFSPTSESTSVSMIFGAIQPSPSSPKVPVVAPLAVGSEADDYAKVVASRNNPLPVDNIVPQPIPPATNKRNTGLVIVLVFVGTILLSLLIWVIVARISK